MRIAIAAIVLLVAGIFLSAYLLIDNRTSNPLQRVKVSGCSECHSEERLTFDSTVSIHGKHVGFECTQCHVQLAQVMGCEDCHSSGIPTYKKPLRVHDKHAALSCSRCHGDGDDLKATEKLHTVFVWISLGLILSVLTGIIANLIFVGQSKRVN